MSKRNSITDCNTPSSKPFRLQELIGGTGKVHTDVLRNFSFSNNNEITTTTLSGSTDTAGEIGLQAFTGIHFFIQFKACNTRFVMRSCQFVH
jgi:hypothetical protein